MFQCKSSVGNPFYQHSIPVWLCLRQKTEQPLIVIFIYLLLINAVYFSKKDLNVVGGVSKPTIFMQTTLVLYRQNSKANLSLYTHRITS